MQQLASYLSGAWQTGRGNARTIHHAISGEALWEVTSAGLDMAQARRFAIERGGKALGHSSKLRLDLVQVRALIGHLRKFHERISPLCVL